MKLLKMVWEWIVGVVRLFRRGSLWVALAGVVILAGCTSAKTNLESKHGYSGRVNGTWTDINVVPTIIQEGESALQSDYGSSGQMRDMPSTFEIDAAGNIRATGVAAYLMALANLCGRAPQAEMCGNAAFFP